jgi:hypothetical protein
LDNDDGPDGGEREEGEREAHSTPTKPDKDGTEKPKARRSDDQQTGDAQGEAARLDWSNRQEEKRRVKQEIEERKEEEDSCAPVQPLFFGKF